LTCRKIPAIRRNILPPSSALKMEAICSTETLVYTYTNPQGVRTQSNLVYSLKCYIKRPVFIVFFNLCLGLQVSQPNFVSISSAVMHARFLAKLVLLNLITLVIIGE
jgi:hypothetical protein